MAGPIGAASFLALAVMCLGFLVFHLFGVEAVAFGGRAWVAFYMVCYVVFSPAVACCLFSLLFEKPKMPAMAGLALAGITLVTVHESWLLLDSLLVLPFLFFGILGMVKFFRWRTRHTRWTGVR